MSSRNRPVVFKVNLKEEKFLQDMADKNNLDVSKYIRARLFEDHNFEEKGEDKKSTNKFEKDVVKLLANSYNLIFKIAEKNFAEDELLEASKKSKDWIEKNEYN